ncbi:hypothetical protein NQ315_000651 [Exocentrus adspersus]|uniref:Myb/SANT-like DNA-binding domain-containing protein n=1 Tax=Exocentrus adspersus TaxID=1586481 RepID=A0AAV8VNG0_9CUCU|nr:hypothetical protein NQ315_000651 [Exocentrus adspersus]
MELLQLEDGTLLRFNPQLYEIVEVEDKHEEETQKNSTNVEDDASSSKSGKAETLRIWTYDTTCFLINLVQEFDQEFQRSIKKLVWKKICNRLEKEMKVTVSPQQCDTKWKGLVETYKNVKKHNDTSGNNKKDWPYFELMDIALNKKPEINPVATCSSSSGLKHNEEKENDSNADSFSSSASSATSGFQSRFCKKRKTTENAVERRHKEKMARQDRYLEIFESLVNTLKKDKEN